jgi:hypothetical protein
MARRLNTHVHVAGAWYGPDDTVPDDVAGKIGDHAWADDDQDDGGTVGFTDPADGDQGNGGEGGGVEAPPRSGRGSGVEAWRTFAEQNALDVADDASREDIIAAAEQAGLVEPEQPKE